MMTPDHIEDDPNDANRVIAYFNYGTPNQIAISVERWNRAT